MICIKPIAAYTDNYIWCLYNEQTRQALVVDPGDAAPVHQFLKEHSLTLTAILVTHHHFDHVGGIADLVEAHRASIFGPVSEQYPNVDQTLAEGDSLELLGVNFQIIAVPGHTLDHIAYFSEDTEKPTLFCGDTLFAGGCGRIFEGDAPMMLNSLNKLAALPDTTQIYCAHEYTLANLTFALAVEPGNEALQKRFKDDSTRREQSIPTVPASLAMEKATNPFLRYTEAEVVATIKEREPSTEPGLAVFHSLREWKNQF